MMDAVTFVKERKRICETHQCDECPLRKFADCIKGEPEELVKAVEAWSKEHPIKTNGTKVWELIPGDVRSTNFHAADEGVLLGQITGSDYIELLVRRSWWDDEYKEQE
jgi:hypothetical protein